MLTSSFLRRASFLAALLVTASAEAGFRTLPVAIDINPDPNILEVELVADEAQIDIDLDGQLDNVLAYNGLVPGPLLEAKVGDEVIIHFTNNMDALDTTVHLHGVELDADSDGSPVTQDLIHPGGGTFTYRFRVFRAGIFWYHPHVQPTDQSFRGLYGPIIFTGDEDDTLVSLGVLPTRVETVVLSDTTICDGTELTGVCSELNCGPAGGSACGAGDIPFVQPDFDCRLGGATACSMALGTSMLINGRAVQPGDTIPVLNGGGLRLILISSSVLRYHLIRPPTGYQFLRVGGQGGLLDEVRVEKGTDGIYDDADFDDGDILLAPGDRADVVILPTGNNGDVLTTTARDYARTNGVDGDELFRIEVKGAPPVTPYSIAEGDPILTHPAINAPIEVLVAPPGGFDDLLTPERVGADLGSSNPLIELQANVIGLCSSSLECREGVECRDDANLLCPSQSTARSCACQADGPGPAIDGYRGVFDAVHFDDYTQIPSISTSRFAAVGDVLELSVKNATVANHPFHLHGFSHQAVRLEDDMGATLWTFPYAEFVDNSDIRPGQTLVLRVRLDDRPHLTELAETPTGGAPGRWLFHCHIVHHAGLGMISELVVIEEDVFSDDFETGDTSVWDLEVP